MLPGRIFLFFFKISQTYPNSTSSENIEHEKWWCAAERSAAAAHQWTEGNNLEDALQSEEGCENDV